VRYPELRGSFICVYVIWLGVFIKCRQIFYPLSVSLLNNTVFELSNIITLASMTSSRAITCSLTL